MASSASTVLRLEIMTNGENNTTWGTKSNANLQLLEAAIAGTTALATTGGSTTLTNVDYTNDQAKAAVIDVSGSLSSNATVIIPNASRLYRFFNRTSGSYTLTIKTSSGSGIVLTQGAAADIYCNGSDVVRFASPITDYTTGAPATSSGAAASSVSVVPAGNLSSSNVQAALSELQGDVDTINTSLGNYQPLDGDLTAIAGLAKTKGNQIVGNGTNWTSLSVGTNGFAMIADSTQSSGVKWAALVPAGSITLWYQAAAPTGWEISGSETDYAVRVVSSGGGTAFSGLGFTTAFSASRTIAQANLPNVTFPDTFAVTTGGSHTHSFGFNFGDANGAGGIPLQGATVGGTFSGTTGSHAGHTHTLTGSVTSGGSGTPLNFAVSYINMIKCAKSAY